MKEIEKEAPIQSRIRTTSTFKNSLFLEEAFPAVSIVPEIIDFGAIVINQTYRVATSITNHGKF